MLQALGDTIRLSFDSIWTGLVAIIPHLFWAIVIFVVGWIIATFVGKLIAHLVKAIKLDPMLEQAGFGNVVKRAGLTLNSAAFIGGIVKWFIIIVSLVAAFDILGFSQVNLFLRTVVLLYLPQVLIAVLIFLVSIVIADVLSKIVISSAKTAGVHSANFLGTITRWAIWIFALLAALAQLQIAEGFINTLFTGVIVALSIAFGLAFGLGGQEAAARFIEKTRSEIQSHRKE